MIIKSYLQKGWLPLIALLSAFTGLQNDTNAAVLAAESFTYATGSGLNGLNGGTGWAGAWSNADGDVTLANTNASLAYPASTNLTSSGGRLQLGTADTSATATRLLSTGMSLSPNGNNFYSSALINISAIGQSAIVQFQDNSGNIRWNYGINAAGNFTVGVAPENAGQNAIIANTVAELGTTYLVVARIRTNTAAGNDEVFLKIFDPSDAVSMPLDDSGWDASANGNSGVTLTRTNLVFGNAGGQALQFDELRIGTTFADVAGVPEPARAMMLAIAALGLMLPRHRRGVYLSNDLSVQPSPLM